jgi:DNA-binding XRE family transcriptional regulator
MNLLKFYRVESGLSQWELAKASGVPRWAIQLIEQGHRCPSSKERSALASTFAVSEDALFAESHGRHHE